MGQSSTFVFANTKFGRKTSGVTSFNVISNMGQAMPTFLDTPQILTVSAGGGTDSASSTGMRQVRLLGFGSGFVGQIEDVWLNTTNPVSTSLEWLRVDRMFGLRVGSNQVNASDIFAGTGTVNGGIPLNRISHIFSGDGQTQELKWTVPISHEAHIDNMFFTSGKATGVDVVTTFRLRSRGLDAPDRPWLIKYDADALDGEIGPFSNKLVIIGPADIIVEGKGTALGARQSGSIGYELHRKLQE